MKQYRVTLAGEAREVYIVEADSAEDAADRWDVDGFLDQTTCFGMDVTSVEEDDE